MSDSFYGKDGLKSVAKLMELNKDLFESFFAFDKKVYEEGSLSTKVKELIAVGAAHITRCPYCINSHVARAKKAGASDEEIAEGATVELIFPAGVVSIASQTGGYYNLIGGFWAQYWSQSNAANQYKHIDQYQIQSGDFNRQWREIYAGAKIHIIVSP